MGYYIKTSGNLTKEQIEKDENLVLEDDRLMLKDNKDASALIYGEKEDDFNYYKIGTFNSLPLFKYLFQKYDLYFAWEEAEEYACYDQFIDWYAYYWMNVTEYMLNVCEWDEGDKAKIEAKRAEHLPHFKYLETIKRGQEIEEFFKLMHYVWDREENKVLQSNINRLEHYIEYIVPHIMKHDGEIPDYYINSIQVAIKEYNEIKDTLVIENDIKKTEIPF